MRKPHFVALLLLFYNTAFAQNYIDLVKFDYALTPENKFKDSSTTTSLQEVNGELTAPIKINEKFTLLTGFIYESNKASFNPGRAEETVYGTTLKLGANIKHSAHWSGTYVFLPKLSSDLKTITNHDFQTGVYALMQYTKSTHLNYKFGAYVNSDLFGPFIVPLLGIYYLNANEKLEVKGVLPVSADINYSLTNNFRLGLSFKGQVRSFHLNTPLELEQNRYLVKSTNDVYAYLQYGMNNGLHFQFAFGRSLARSFRIYDERVNFGLPLYYSGDSRTQLNSEFSDGWLSKLAVFYRLKINS